VLTTIKIAMPEVERHFDHNVSLAVKKALHAVSLKKFKKPSTMALSEIIAAAGAPFDLIYIDGSHQAPDVLADSVLAFELLRVGGLNDLRRLSVEHGASRQAGPAQHAEARDRLVH